MKKFLLLLASLTIVLGLAACGGSKGEEVDCAIDPSNDACDYEDPNVDATSWEIALVTDIGDIDDGSFNQGAWEGVVRYSWINGITHTYYKPQGEGTADYVTAINLAITNGATTVVCPGFMFSDAVAEASVAHPNVKFIVLDAFMPVIEDNTAVLAYAEHQSGFLAGYAAVMDGNRELGFIGGVSVPAVVRFGYGFIQGANQAAVELGLEDDAVTVKYWYSNVFWPDPTVVDKSTGWYQGGTEVIFAAAGGAGSSVVAAAFAQEALMIGVDVDQSGLGDEVLTSAMKELANSVNDTLASIYDGTFVGGGYLDFDVENDGVGLPFDNSRFENFTEEQYNAIFAKLVSGEVVVDGGFEDTLEEVDAANPKVDVVTE